MPFIIYSLFGFSLIILDTALILYRVLMQTSFNVVIGNTLVSAPQILQLDYG